MKALIVIFGNLGHGKDALADRLADHLSDTKPVYINFHRIAFATALKEAVGMFVGIKHEHLYGTQEQKLTPYYGKPARHYLQWLGTEIGRDQIDRNLWVHRCIDKGLESGKDYVIVSDGRFWNELEEPQRYLGDRAKVVTVLIVRPGAADPVGRPPTRFWRFVSRLASLVGIKVPVMHPSESEVLEMRHRSLGGERLFDHVIINDNGLDLLNDRAAQLAKKVKQAVE